MSKITRIDLAGHVPRCSHRGWLVLPVRRRAAGLWLGWWLGPIPPHGAFQRKPERDHDQAEDDDRTRMPSPSMAAGGAGLAWVVTADPHRVRSDQSVSVSV
jgi:hypothetical protein